MELIKNSLAYLLILHIVAGPFMWAYVAYELGSFLMFWCVCLIPVSVPVGIYMIYFETPKWLLSIFS